MSTQPSRITEKSHEESQLIVPGRGNAPYTDLVNSSLSRAPEHAVYSAGDTNAIHVDMPMAGYCRPVGFIPHPSFRPRRALLLSPVPLVQVPHPGRVLHFSPVRSAHPVSSRHSLPETSPGRRSAWRDPFLVSGVFGLCVYGMWTFLPMNRTIAQRNQSWLWLQLLVELW